MVLRGSEVAPIMVNRPFLKLLDLKPSLMCSTLPSRAPDPSSVRTLRGNAGGIDTRMIFWYVFICSLVSGCQPAGRSVEGVFTVNGEPRAGVEVRLSSNLEDFSNCGKAPLAAVTDQAGEFKAIVRKLPIRPCFDVDGKTYSTMFVVDDGETSPIKLKCRLPLETTGHFEDSQICY